MGRAAALGKYRVGAPLPFEDLRFARSSSAVAVALAWPARGSPESPAAARAAIAEVEAFSADTGYPQTRFDVGTRAAAELLRRVGHGDIAEMGALLAQAVPPPRAGRHPRPGPGSDRSGGQFPLANRRTARRVARTRPTPRAWIGHGPRACQRCGKPLHSAGSRGGRPAKYCSGTCRTAAHRARHRTTPETAAR